MLFFSPQLHGTLRGKFDTRRSIRHGVNKQSCSVHCLVVELGHDM